MSFACTRRTLIAGTAALAVVRPARAQAPLVLRAAEAEIPLPDVALQTPAFNGMASGPLIEIPRGQRLAMKIENALDFEFHFRPQGLRGKAVQGNETPIAPGETREIIVTPPDAGSFVYRAGSEGGLNVTRTVLLSGPLVVTAEQPRVADREVVLAVNTLIIPDADETKPPQRLVTVNGMPDMKITARPGEKLRLRAINLAQEGLAALEMPKGTDVVAVDGQPSEPFPPFENAVILPPLGRADLVLTVPKDGTEPILIADHFEPAHTLLSITVEGEAMPDRYLAKRLPENTLLPKEMPFQSAARASWKPGGGATPDPLLSVRAGVSVVLTFESNGSLHALLLDGQTARLLDALDDGWKPWWQDSFLIHPDETMRLAFLPKEPGRYALDLIPLEGNGAWTRAWIEVTPGS